MRCSTSDHHTSANLRPDVDETRRAAAVSFRVTGKFLLAKPFVKVTWASAATGDVLWKAMVGGQVSAGPITYAINKKQYVSLPAGNAVFTFALRRYARIGTP